MKALATIEHAVKGPVFGCSMCGQRVLHSTGLTCPMTCPKQLRNGPCGGVRADGGCEVKPEMRCVWLKAWDRAERLPWTDEFHEQAAGRQSALGHVVVGELGDSATGGPAGWGPECRGWR